MEGILWWLGSLLILGLPLQLTVRDGMDAAAWRCTASPTKAQVSTLLILARVKGEKPAGYKTLSSPCLNSTTPLWLSSSALCSAPAGGPPAALFPLPSQLAPSHVLPGVWPCQALRLSHHQWESSLQLITQSFRGRRKKLRNNMPSILPDSFSFLFCSSRHPVFQSYVPRPVCG